MPKAKAFCRAPRIFILGVSRKGFRQQVFPGGPTRISSRRTAVRPSGASAEKYAPFVGALRLRIGEVSGRRVPRDFPPFAEHPNFRSISQKKKRDTELDGAVRRRSRFVQRVPHRRPRCSKMPTRLPALGLQRSVAEYKASAKKKTKELRSQVTGARGLAGG